MATLFEQPESANLLGNILKSIINPEPEEIPQYGGYSGAPNYALQPDPFIDPQLLAGVLKAIGIIPLALAKQSVKKISPKVTEDLVKVFHGTKEFFMPSIKKHGGLKATSMEAQAADIAAKLKIPKKDVIDIIEGPKGYLGTWYKPGTKKAERGARSLNEKLLYATKSKERAKDYAEWAGEGYHSTLLDILNEPKIPGNVKVEAQKIIDDLVKSKPKVFSFKLPKNLTKTKHPEGDIKIPFGVLFKDLLEEIK